MRDIQVDRRFLIGTERYIIVKRGFTSRIKHKQVVKVRLRSLLDVLLGHIYGQSYGLRRELLLLTHLWEITSPRCPNNALTLLVHISSRMFSDFLHTCSKGLIRKRTVELNPDLTLPMPGIENVILTHIEAIPPDIFHLHDGAKRTCCHDTLSTCLDGFNIGGSRSVPSLERAASY